MTDQALDLESLKRKRLLGLVALGTAVCLIAASIILFLVAPNPFTEGSYYPPAPDFGTAEFAIALLVIGFLCLVVYRLFTVFSVIQLKRYDDAAFGPYLAPVLGCLLGDSIQAFGAAVLLAVFGLGFSSREGVFNPGYVNQPTFSVAFSGEQLLLMIIAVAAYFVGWALWYRGVVKGGWGIDRIVRDMSRSN